MVDLGPPVLLHHKGRLVSGPLAHKDEEDVISYSGNAGGSVAVATITESVSPMLNYFEIKIVNKGERRCISVGVGSLGFPQGQQPGWIVDSIGYHADDGKLFQGAGYGCNFGPTCTTGDRMGCGIDFEIDPNGNKVGVFFTKNGFKIGDTTEFQRPVNGLYPLFGLHSKGESIQYLGHWHVSPDTLEERMSLECSPSTYWIRSNGIRFLNDGLTLEYAGEGGNIQDCALAQANIPLSPTNHYFELEIIDRGADGCIAIGLAKLTYPLSKHPGWDKGSIGYHADDGRLFHEKGVGAKYGTACTTGDVMGCGIRFSADDVTDNDIGSDDECSSSESDPNMIGGGGGGMLHGGENVHANIIGGYRHLFNDDVFGGNNVFGGQVQVPELNWSDDEDDDDEPGRLFPRRGPFGFLRQPNLAGPGRGRFIFHPQNPILPQYKPLPPQTNGKTDKANDEKKQRKVTVYFTKNGKSLDDVECDLPSGGFYPVVGLLSKKEKVKVNLFPLSG